MPRDTGCNTIPPSTQMINPPCNGILQPLSPPRQRSGSLGCQYRWQVTALQIPRWLFPSCICDAAASVAS